MRSQRFRQVRTSGFAIAALPLLLASAGACRASAPRPVGSGSGTLLTDSIASTALAGNRLGDSPVRRVSVYLPPSYAVAARRYPVLYLLHGFDGTDAAWLRGPQYQQFNIAQAMDSLIAAGAVREMIVVMPDARNRVGGSFYMDSPVTGGWERFTARELVAWTDGRFRTLRSAASRAVAGHSMGGFGALRLAARYGGEVYSVAYALSPCCARLREVPTGRFAAAWDSVLVMRSLDDLPRLGFVSRVNLALALALTPDTSAPGVPARLPYRRAGQELVPVEPATARWNRGMTIGALAAGAERLALMSWIRVDVGDDDALVPVADVMALDSALWRAGARHHAEVYDGTHGSRIRERMVTQVLPFVSAVLDHGR